MVEEKNNQEAFYINEEPHNSKQCYFRVYENGQVEEISETEATENGVIGSGLGNKGGKNKDYRYVLSNVAFISYNDTPTTFNSKGARIPQEWDYGQETESEMRQNPMTWINANKIKGDIPKEAIMFAIEHLANEGYIDRGGNKKKKRGTSSQQGEWVDVRLTPSPNAEGSYEDIVSNSDIGSWDDEVDQEVYNKRGKEARDMAIDNGKKEMSNRILGTNHKLATQLSHLIRKGYTLSEAKAIIRKRMMFENRINKVVKSVLMSEGLISKRRMR